MNARNASAIFCLTALLVLSMVAGCSQNSGSTVRQQSVQAGTIQGAAGNDQTVAPLVKNPYANTDTIERSIAFLMPKYNKTERPTVRVLSDTDSLKAKQPAIFSKAKDGMLLATWDDLLVIYDPRTSRVVQELRINSMGV